MIKIIPEFQDWLVPVISLIICPVPVDFSENLEQLQTRVRKLEVNYNTSTLFSTLGWSCLGIGTVIWTLVLFTGGGKFFPSLLSLALTAVGASLVALSFFASHSEKVESAERQRRIREKNTVNRCLYLEGNVPEGKGSIGRCQLYDFNMADYPYCIYCREYSPSMGSPKI